MTIKRSYAPLIVILFGVIFSLYLQRQIPNGVFFSGDAGLKALLAEQFSQGQFRFDLIPPPQSWVRNLWSNGYNPFEEPFVYHLNNRYYITFPFTFPLITAPFKALFGERGLYVIPLLSTWAIWFIFYGVCQRLRFSQIITSIALIVVIFASPLTLYSAMYWEHTLVVALAFQGLALLLIPSQNQGLSTRNAMVSGILIGGSVWFRPELLGLASLLIIVVYGVSLSNWNQSAFMTHHLQLNKLAYLANKKELFVASIVLTIGLFFICNQMIYNQPLGIHAIQVVEKSSLSERLLAGWTNFQGLGLSLFEYFPIALFSIAYLLIALGKEPGQKLSLKLLIPSGLAFGNVALVGLLVMRGNYQMLYLLLLIGLLGVSFLKKTAVRLPIEMILIYLGGLLFVVQVSLMVPMGTAGLIAGGKQWGPRFLLILIPIIALLVAQQLAWLGGNKSRLKYIAFLVFSLLLLVGIHKTIYLGAIYLQENHDLILPALQAVQKNPNPAIAISHQFVAQTLQPGVGEQKFFFKVEDYQDLVQLGKALIAQSQENFTYICYPFRPCELPKAYWTETTFNQGKQKFKIVFSEQGKFGNYPIYNASIIQI